MSDRQPSRGTLQVMSYRCWIIIEDGEDYIVWADRKVPKFHCTCFYHLHSDGHCRHIDAVLEHLLKMEKEGLNIHV